ncbi:MAG TPA: iron donor protein CyaY [Alloacidobacterium sp.]|nr:iron donor protein CyaY [Alloacidobacterium sp.]
MLRFCDTFSRRGVKILRVLAVLQRSSQIGNLACYTDAMLDELTFRKHADAAIESLKRSLIAAEEDGDFEAEEQNGVLNIVFDEPPAKFVITPNTPVRQIWISALSTSFKLDWSEDANGFVLLKDGTPLKPLVARLINEHLGTDSITLH